MPDIHLSAHPFDIAFHPNHNTVYAGLLTGHVNAYTYDEDGDAKRVWSARPSKKSCRSLAVSQDGKQLWYAGKGKSLATIDTTTGVVSEKRVRAHDASINRVAHFSPGLLSTGDDEGVIKLWDPRQKDAVRTYTQHFDYITDFLWLENKKHLVATSGDGTLSVMDVRYKNPKPHAQSEDQEDELLSIVPIKGGSKFVVGTQLGILSIFNQSSGWGDCVDRVPGHPQSVDTMLALPPSFSNAKGNTILTGSSDGFIRAVEILPTKLLGVVADHGEFPVERMALGRGIASGGDTAEKERAGSSSRVGGQSDSDDDSPVSDSTQERWWLGSIGHDELLKLTDLRAALNQLEGGDAKEDEAAEALGDDDEVASSNDDEAVDTAIAAAADAGDSSSDEEAETLKERKRKRKPEKNPLMINKKKGRNEVDADKSFFEGL
ncbi:hypothetical protein HGRIS_012408 [Hohenbuehelia grisea]|uniref:WD repeat-containing protein JIP5 n=1 Tax=Hohenbuehelia grisea TaxID=104357 RepID=A0ABR3IS75_9AGAR